MTNMSDRSYRRLVWDRAVIENRFRCPQCNTLLFTDGRPDENILIIEEEHAAGCPFCHNHVGRIFEIPENFINNNYERRFSEHGQNN